MASKIDMSKVDADRFMDGLLKVVSAPLERIAVRVKKLEEREFPYKGVYQRSNEYERGAFVTFKGSMWHCCADTTRQQPGTGSDWQLAVKGSE